MDKSANRDFLVELYHSYLNLLSERGIDFPSIDKDKLQVLDDVDLRRVINELKALSRTPK